MRPGIRRFAFGAFAAMGLFAATAQAQTPITTSKVNLDAATVIASSSSTAASEGALPASVFAPKVKASFAAQQMGPRVQDQGISFGVLGMITRAKFTGDDLFNVKSRTGGGFGFWIGGNRNGHVGFTGEFIYLTRNIDANGNQFKSKVLEIPAVFHINFGSRSRNSVGGYIVLGPVVSINLKQSINNGPAGDNFNGADIGLIGGLGVEVMRIGIEGRGNWGFTNISKSGTTSDARTFTFELLGKFAFN